MIQSRQEEHLERAHTRYTVIKRKARTRSPSGRIWTVIEASFRVSLCSAPIQRAQTASSLDRPGTNPRRFCWFSGKIGVWSLWDLTREHASEVRASFPSFPKTSASPWGWRPVCGGLRGLEPSLLLMLPDRPACRWQLQLLQVPTSGGQGGQLREKRTRRVSPDWVAPKLYSRPKVKADSFLHYLLLEQNICNTKFTSLAICKYTVLQHLGHLYSSTAITTNYAQIKRAVCVCVCVHTRVYPYKNIFGKIRNEH